MIKNVVKNTAALVVAFVLQIVLFSAFGWGQVVGTTTTATATTAPASLDAEMAAAKAQVAVIQIEKQVESLTTQEKTLEKKLAASGPALTTDAAMDAAQTRVKILEIKQAIAELKAQQAALLNPPPAPVIPVVPTLAPVNCVPAQGPNVTVHAPPKASKWVCDHLGVCVDNKPVQLPTSSACPAGMTPAAGTAPKQK